MASRTLNISIYDRKNYVLTVNLCQPYPTGIASASAVPLSKFGRLAFLSAPTPSGLPTYENASLAGQQLKQVSWDSVSQSWSAPVNVPPVPLSASYDSSTGVIRVVVPFGVSFNNPSISSSNELLAGNSPTFYSYSVSMGGAMLLKGNIEVGSPPPDPPPQVSVCNVTHGFQAASQTQDAIQSGAQAESPWLVKG